MILHYQTYFQISNPFATRKSTLRCIVDKLSLPRLITTSRFRPATYVRSVLLSLGSSRSKAWKCLRRRVSFPRLYVFTFPCSQQPFINPYPLNLCFSIRQAFVLPFLAQTCQFNDERVILLEHYTSIKTVDRVVFSTSPLFARLPPACKRQHHARVFRLEQNYSFYR